MLVEKANLASSQTVGLSNIKRISGSGFEGSGGIFPVRVSVAYRASMMMTRMWYFWGAASFRETLHVGYLLGAHVFMGLLPLELRVSQVAVPKHFEAQCPNKHLRGTLSNNGTPLFFGMCRTFGADLISSYSLSDPQKKQG